jgi:hypothetical protein
VHDRLNASGHPAKQLITEHAGMFGFTEVLYNLVELGNLLMRVPEDSAYRIQEREYCG